jgi:hypothetical protein
MDNEIGKIRSSPGASMEEKLGGHAARMGIEYDDTPFPSGDLLTWRGRANPPPQNNLNMSSI